MSGEGEEKRLSFSPRREKKEGVRESINFLGPEKGKSGSSAFIKREGKGGGVERTRSLFKRKKEKEIRSGRRKRCKKTRSGELLRKGKRGGIVRFS